jgi:hypothetical protein
MKKNSLGLSRGASFLAQLAVGLVFLLLPFTSLPWLSKLMVGPSAPPGSVGPTVAPPSIIFIFAMTVTWLPIYLLRGGKLPGETRPFLVFVAGECQRGHHSNLVLHATLFYFIHR